MTPEYRHRVQHTIVSLTVCSHYHYGCRASLLTTSPVQHNFPCIARNTKIGGGRRRQRPSRQIFPWPSRCGGEEIRLIMRDKELFVNKEQVRTSFCKNGEAWFVCVRSRSDGYWWNMGGTTSSPTQDLFDSQDFENAGIGHGNIRSFKLITNVRSNAAPTKRESLGSLRKNFRYFRWMQHYHTN